MTGHGKGWITILFTLIITFIYADGVQPDGSGTEEDPYQIATLDNLLWISTTDSCWSSHFIQTADIDAYDTQNWNGGEGWVPIGAFASFSGIYDGQDHAVHGLYINRDGGGGMFGCISNNAVVRNLQVIDLDYSVTGGAGGVCGMVRVLSSVVNCHTSGSIVSTGDEVGGVVASLFVTSLHESSSSCDVQGDFRVGGLVGVMNDGYISKCRSSGTVTVTCEYGGGLVGEATGGATIRQSCSSGDVFCAGPYVGGLVGVHGIGNARIEDCYCLGDVEGSENVGGFVGITGCHSYIVNCYCCGAVQGNEDTGGFAGDSQLDVNVSNCFWNIDTSDQQTSAEGVGITDEEMMSIGTFLEVGWDFIGEAQNGEEDIWCIDAQINDGYPYLSWQTFLPNDTPVVPSVAATQLHGNYPNPFNPETTISFSVQPNDTATLAIYNLKGQKVKSCGEFQTGEYKIIWDGTNDALKPVASGVYMCRLKSKNSTQTRKLMLLK